MSATIFLLVSFGVIALVAAVRQLPTDGLRRQPIDDDALAQLRARHEAEAPRIDRAAASHRPAFRIRHP